MTTTIRFDKALFYLHKETSYRKGANMGCQGNKTYRLDSLARCLRSLLVIVLCGSLALIPTRAQGDPDPLDAEYETALAQLDSISQQYSYYAGELEQTRAALEDVREQIAENERQAEVVQQDIARCQEELSSQREVLQGYVVAGYKTGGLNLLTILFSSSSFEEAVSKLYYYNSICNAEVEAIDAVTAKKTELENSQAELSSLELDLRNQEAELEALYNQQNDQMNAMHEQQEEAAAYLASLSEEIKKRVETEEPELVGISEVVAQEEQKEEEREEEDAADQPTPAPQTTQEQPASEQPAQQQSNPPQEQQTEPVPAITGNGSLQALINTAWNTGPTRAEWGCAGWVYTVYLNAGIYSQMPRCAGWYAENFCYSSNRNDLRPGMVVAVPTHPYTEAGKIYGHVGIYVGDGIVRDFAGGSVRSVPIDDWINSYSSPGIPVRWGWVGGIALS